MSSGEHAVESVRHSEDVHRAHYDSGDTISAAADICDGGYIAIRSPGRSA